VCGILKIYFLTYSQQVLQCFNNKKLSKKIIKFHYGLSQMAIFRIFYYFGARCAPTQTNFLEGTKSILFPSPVRNYLEITFPMTSNELKKLRLQKIRLPGFWTIFEIFSPHKWKYFFLLGVGCLKIFFDEKILYVVRTFHINFRSLTHIPFIISHLGFCSNRLWCTV